MAAARPGSGATCYPWTVVVADIAPGAGTAATGKGGERRAVVAVLAVCALVVAAWALLRWSGVAPFGSDNDEYRLVAQELADSGRPLVAGIEATKYPLGYPLFLAGLELVGLAVTPLAVAANLALVLALAGAVVLVARDAAVPAAPLPAALFAVAGAGLWGSVYVVMPDLAFVVVSGLVLWQAGRLRTTPQVWLLSGGVAVAVLLKSQGLLLAPAAALAVVVAGRPLRRWAWAPLAAGGGLTGAMAALNLPYAEHTTGYARTFSLARATDAAAGDASLVDIAARLFTRAHLVLQDVGFAVIGFDVPPPWSWLVALALVAAGVRALWGSPPRRAYVLAFLAVWLPALAIWPYSSVRFQLPLVPVAAVGVGALVSRLVRALPRAGPALAAAALGLYLATSALRVAGDADREAASVAPVARDTGAMAAWGRANIAEGEAIASFAYREVAYRLDRPVVALGYTSDMDELWRTARAGDARWLVVMPSLYGARGALELQFLAAFGDRLRLAQDTATVDTYEILAP